jgi:heme O synthase-like polyprenyltransferase
VLWRAGQSDERKAAMRLFAFSIFYLFAVFTALAVEKLLGFAPGA